MTFNKNFKILIFTQLKVEVETRRSTEKVKKMKRGKEERRSARRMEDPSVKEVILKLPFLPVNLIFLFCFMYSYNSHQRRKG